MKVRPPLHGLTLTGNGKAVQRERRHRQREAKSPKVIKAEGAAQEDRARDARVVLETASSILRATSRACNECGDASAAWRRAKEGPRRAVQADRRNGQCTRLPDRHMCERGAL